MPSTNLILTIDRLVLDGLPLKPGEERLVRAALESELARLLAEGGMPASWQSGGAIPSLPSILGPAGATPSETGRAVAHSVYSSLGGGSQAGGGKRD